MKKILTHLCAFVWTAASNIKTCPLKALYQDRIRTRRCPVRNAVITIFWEYCGNQARTACSSKHITAVEGLYPQCCFVRKTMRNSYESLLYFFLDTRRNLFPAIIYNIIVVWRLSSNSATRRIWKGITLKILSAKKWGKRACQVVLYRNNRPMWWVDKCYLDTSGAF
jgi:hypothetical protein